MPFGISWGRYLAGMAGAMISMLAGAQTVHMIYKPMQNLIDKKAEFHKKRLEILRKQLEEDEENQ